ncbi:Coatomer subunit delta [Morella rubra]|uniref:Coatomer subunit delta n=1 Tax=Morella rubra TaxID=262757 RepID=A0A6A1VV65_9ROSI|nr:Coatomer subunit delta [Morella rubra]
MVEPEESGEAESDDAELSDYTLMALNYLERCLAVQKVWEVKMKIEMYHVVSESSVEGLAQDGCRMDALAVLYTSVKSAHASVAMLHQKKIRGRMVWAHQLGGEALILQLAIAMVQIDVDNMSPTCCKIFEVKQHCEMESHEEKLHKLVLQSKINETKDHMKRKASEIEKSKVLRTCPI